MRHDVDAIVLLLNEELLAQSRIGLKAYLVFYLFSHKYAACEGGQFERIIVPNA